MMMCLGKNENGVILDLLDNFYKRFLLNFPKLENFRLYV